MFSDHDETKLIQEVTKCCRISQTNLSLTDIKSMHIMLRMNWNH